MDYVLTALLSPGEYTGICDSCGRRPGWTERQARRNPSLVLVPPQLRKGRQHPRRGRITPQHRYALSILQAACARYRYRCFDSQATRNAYDDCSWSWQCAEPPLIVTPNRCHLTDDYRHITASISHVLSPSLGRPPFAEPRHPPPTVCRLPEPARRARSARGQLSFAAAAVRSVSP